MFMMKKVIVIISTIVLLVVAYSVYLFNKKTQSLQKVVPDYIMTADDLFEEFETDENSAVLKYESKVLQVTGKVLMVTKTDSISNIILIAEDAMMGGVNCSFKNLENNLKKNDIVIIKGRCQGYLTNVILNNCVLVK